MRTVRSIGFSSNKGIGTGITVSCSDIYLACYCHITIYGSAIRAINCLNTVAVRPSGKRQTRRHFSVSAYAYADIQGCVKEYGIRDGRGRSELQAE